MITKVLFERCRIVSPRGTVNSSLFAHRQGGGQASDSACILV
jgi:hypothetical protein